MIETLALAVLLAAPAAPASPAPAAVSAPSPAASPAPAAEASAVTAASVKSATSVLVDAFKRVKEDDGKLSDADKAANKKAYEELDELLARAHFTSAVIAPRKDKFSPAELKAFQDEFWDLVQRIAYPGSGAFFREGQVKYAEPKEKGGVWTHELTAYIPSEDLETVVGLQWKLEGGKLRIVDVLFDGDSLVKDYQNQFARIVDKEGAAGVMKKLAEKREELTKKAGAAK
jgi:ABC-type transport system involved in resistance to organic solvents, auxiliary component